MSILKEWLKAIGVLIACFVIGLAGGLLYGFVIDDIEYTDVDPVDLALTYKEDYVSLIAADYTQTLDLPLAQQRLRQLGFTEDSVGKRAEQALLAKEPSAGALARLATDLGFGNERITAALVTPSATATLKPTATVKSTSTPTIISSPTRTSTSTRTPRPSPTPRPSRTVRPSSTATIEVEASNTPSATRSPSVEVEASNTRLPTRTPSVEVEASNTRSPTRTPSVEVEASNTRSPTRTPSVTRTLERATLTATATLTAEPATLTATPTLTALPSTTTVPLATATPAFDFVVSSVRMLSIEENGGCEGLNKAYVSVLNSEGKPLNGVMVALRWDLGEEFQPTGNEPPFPGQVEFELYGGYQLLVLNDANGNPVRSQLSRLITSQEPSVTDLIVAGYCSDQADCNTRQSQEQLCEGHYSWEIVFQQTD